MASTIQLKTGTGSAIPTSLAQGEVAINIDSGLFYFGSGSGNDVKPLLNFSGSVTSSGYISASGNIVANDADFKGALSIQGFANVSASLAGAVAGGDDLGNHTATQDLDLDGNNIIGTNHITSSGNISSSGQFIIGRTGSFTKIIINSDLSGSSESPFLITIPDTNGQNQKLQVNHQGTLRFGALDTLPTAITGGLMYSASSFYMGLP